MVITLDGYKVRILAKFDRGGLITGKQYTTEDTCAVINKICNLAWDAAREYEAQGYKALAENAKDLARELHDQLDRQGYYDITTATKY